MSETKRFAARVLLSVTTGRLLTTPNGPDDNGIGDLYELLGWMTGDSPFTHQLPRFSEECKPWLLRWFPELAMADVAVLDDMLTDKRLTPEAIIENWLGLYLENDIEEKYDVPKIPAGKHEQQDPIGELKQMTDKPIVVVNLPE